MAKNMALLKNGLVANILWCSDREPETDTMINCGELPVGIGDSYRDGAFYRDGEKILTAYELLEKQNAELVDAMAAMVEDVYAQDVAEIEGE